LRDFLSIQNEVGCYPKCRFIEFCFENIEQANDQASPEAKGQRKQPQLKTNWLAIEAQIRTKLWLSGAS
jgi:hypothetical protein